METKEAQTVARQAAATTAPTGGIDGEAPASAQEGGGTRKRDDITLRVPNPLLVHQKKTPAPAPVARRPVEPASPHTSPTAELKVSSLIWNEYNSMPQTPSPVSADQAQESATPSASPVTLRNRRGPTIILALVIIGAGAIVGALIPRGKTGPEVRPLPEPKVSVPGTPEKALDVQKAPVAVAAPPAPARPSKRHVSITVEPAEASIVLDGIVVGSHAIALDLLQDKSPHVVQALARGYLPFRKTFTLEADVNLRISLKKGAAPPVAFPKATPPSAPVAKSLESEPSVNPKVEPIEDFGMDLNRPAARRQTKKMDEKDPYSP